MARPIWPTDSDGLGLAVRGNGEGAMQGVSATALCVSIVESSRGVGLSDANQYAQPRGRGNSGPTPKGYYGVARENGGDQPDSLQPGRCARPERHGFAESRPDRVEQHRPKQRLFDDMGHAGLPGAGDHFLGLVAHHQDDGKAEPGKAALAAAVHHAREHVVIEHEAARRLAAGRWRAARNARRKACTSKPSSSSEKRKESARTPSPTAIRMVAASAKSISFKRIARLSHAIEDVAEIRGPKGSCLELGQTVAARYFAARRAGATLAMMAMRISSDRLRAPSWSSDWRDRPRPCAG